MLKFNELRDVIYEFDGWTDGVSPERFSVLEKLVEIIDLDMTEMDPIDLLNVSRILLCGTQQENAQDVVNFVSTMLEEWNDQRECVAAHEKAA